VVVVVAPKNTTDVLRSTTTTHHHYCCESTPRSGCRNRCSGGATARPRTTTAPCARRAAWNWTAIRAPPWATNAGIFPATKVLVKAHRRLPTDADDCCYYYCKKKHGKRSCWRHLHQNRVLLLTLVLCPDQHHHQVEEETSGVGLPSYSSTRANSQSHRRFLHRHCCCLDRLPVEECDCHRLCLCQQHHHDRTTKVVEAKWEDRRSYYFEPAPQASGAVACGLGSEYEDYSPMDTVRLRVVGLIDSHHCAWG